MGVLKNRIESRGIDSKLVRNVMRNGRTATRTDIPEPIENAPGFYMAFFVTEACGRKLQRWAKAAGFSMPLEPTDYHCTIAYSKTIPFNDKFRSLGYFPTKLKAPVKGIKKLGQKAIVLIVDCPLAEDRFDEAMQNGCSHDYPSYISHVTITYNGSGFQPYKLRDIALPDFDIEFDHEAFSPLRDALSVPFVGAAEVVESENIISANDIVSPGIDTSIDPFNKILFSIEQASDNEWRTFGIKKHDISLPGGMLLYSAVHSSYSAAYDMALRTAANYPAFASTIQCSSPPNNIVLARDEMLQGTYFFRDCIDPVETHAIYKMLLDIVIKRGGIQLISYTDYHLSLAVTALENYGHKVEQHNEHHTVDLKNVALAKMGFNNKALVLRVDDKALESQAVALTKFLINKEQVEGKIWTTKTLTQRLQSAQNLHVTVGYATAEIPDAVIEGFNAAWKKALESGKIAKFVLGSQQYKANTFKPGDIMSPSKTQAPAKLSPDQIEMQNKFRTEVRRIESELLRYPGKGPTRDGLLKKLKEAKVKLNNVK